MNKLHPRRRRPAAWILLAGIGVMIPGCVSLDKAYPINRVASGVEVLPLHRDEYQILGDTEGEACAKYLLGGKLPWFAGAPIKSVNRNPDEKPGFFEGSFGVSIPLFGWLFSDRRDIIQEAVYDALEKVEGADALLSVRVKIQRRYRIPPFYANVCATVKGKAFQIKTDAWRGGSR
ncbi:MAG: hypothetical protein HY748_08095 [Elusimicrobia bacterium]|nr:hypothetical protein [Elusimicrobiota bacterium]